MQKLGYEWDLVLKDELNNTYEILLKRDGKSFDITSASSGEKEIINFIFGIFALNVRNGLVAVDEPELHLHPKWQRTLYAVFEDLQKVTGNQFVLATHSPAFITADTLGKLKRVARISGESSVIPLDATSAADRRELLQMINSHNNEKLFFADKVVLVEGIHDRLLFERILAVLRKASGVSEMTAPEIIEVLEVYGKGNLAKYRRLLDSIQVPSFIIADRDYADEIGTPEVKALFTDNLTKVANNTLFNSKSVDRATLAREFHQATKSKDWSRVEKLWDYIVARQRSLTDNLTQPEQATFTGFLAQRRSERTHLLSAGAIEEYLPEGWTSLDKTIELVSSADFETKMKTKQDRFEELRNVCSEVVAYKTPARPVTTT
jgi:putative ATP-dependent endonuclease of OLD family